MYRIYDKAAAIREIQVYLREIADSDIFIAPSGIYDDNTRRAIIDFQSEKGLEITGEVDKATFDLLFSEHLIKKEKNEVPYSLPMKKGDMNDLLVNINRMMKKVLDYYGFTNRLATSSFYSNETARAVDLLRRVYQLENREEIDEIFYKRLIMDLRSIGRISIFRS